MDELKDKALRLGAEDFGISDRKDKRFYVIYNGKRINFGSPMGLSFYDHGDTNERTAWYARHSKIKLKDGSYAIKSKDSSSFWAAKLLWP